MSQPGLLRAFSAIRECKETRSAKDKVAILKKWDSEELRSILYLTYNKFQTYRVKALEYPSTYASLQTDTLPEFESLCHTLANHTLGHIDAKARVLQFLKTNTKEGAEVFMNVLLRDLRIGVEAKTINKAFPGLIPTFNVMLADKAEDLDDIPYPVVAECKLDGCRVIAISDGSTVTFYSREGMVFDEKGVIAAEILTLGQGFPAVYDGEIIAVTPNMNNAICRKNIEGNWKFNYALSALKSESTTAEEVKNHLKYFIWDVIDYKHFTTSGKQGTSNKLRDRKIRLTALFDRDRTTELQNIEMLPNYVCINKAALLAKFKEFRDRGEEGMMIKFPDSPYEYKRSKYLLKMKDFYPFDLRIVGIKPGVGKYEGLLGALVCTDDTGTIKTNVGSGFTDADRAELMMEHISGRLVGQICEVNAQEVTEDGSLRFPTFIGMRPDKTTTNIENAQRR